MLVILYILNTILSIMLIVYFFKSSQVLLFKYENTWKKDMLKNFIPTSTFLRVFALVCLALLTLLILIPNSIGEYTNYKKSVTKEKIEFSENIIKLLYLSNPADLSKEEVINYITQHTTSSTEYKLDTRNLQNLRDRHLNYTSSSSELTFISKTLSNKELVLIYEVTNPIGKKRLLMSRLEFNGDKITTFNEYELTNSVDYDN